MTKSTPAPVSALIPHDYQEAAISAALAARTSVGGLGGVLLADEQGGGKTLTVAEILGRGRTSFRRALLIVLKDTIPQWQERVAAQTGGIQLRVMNGTKAGRAEFDAFLAGEDGWFIAGPQFIVTQDWAHRDKRDAQGQPIPEVDKKTGQPTGKNLRERVHLETYRKMSARKRGQLDAVLVDEVQIFANRKGTGRRTIGTLRGRELSLAASGTWFGEKVENQWAIGRWVWPIDEIVERGYHRWKERYLELQPVTMEGGRVVEIVNPATGHREASMKVSGEKVPGAFAASLPCYLRWENPERPPAATPLLLPPSLAQARQLEDLSRDLFAWVSTWEGDEAPLVVQMPMSLQGRLSQVTIAELSFADAGGTEVAIAPDAESAKLGALRGVLEDYFKGEPALIFTHSKIGAIFYAERMQAAGARVGVYHGDMTAEERLAVKEAFIAGELEYLVATIQACGTGVDGLQRRTSKIVWVSKVPGRAALNEQALFRVFRSGIVGGWSAFEQVELLVDHPASPDVKTAQALVDQAWRNAQALRAGKVAA